MKHFEKITALAAMLCLMISCTQHALRQDMKKFMSENIAFPTDLIKITDGQVSSGKIELYKSVMVFFYGKDECSSCAINHLNDYLSGFIDIEKSEKCRVVILFSPLEDDILDVQNQISELKFPFPIYVDLYGEFYRINKDFPSDRRFHSFLIGKDAHPVFIGNPLRGEKLSKVFKMVLKKINKS